MRPAPDLVPLRPVFDHLAVAIEHDDDVLPSPIDARPAVAPIGCGLAAAGCGTGGLAHRHAAADGELDAGPDLRQPGGSAPAPARQHGQLALLRHDHAVGTLGKHIGGLRPGPRLVVGKALRQRLRPVLHRIVRAEHVLPALESGDGRKPLPGRLLLLSLDNAQPVAHQDDREQSHAYSRNLERSSFHIGASATPTSNCANHTPATPSSQSWAQVQPPRRRRAQAIERGGLCRLSVLLSNICYRRVRRTNR